MIGRGVVDLRQPPEVVVAPKVREVLPVLRVADLEVENPPPVVPHPRQEAHPELRLPLEPRRNPPGSRRDGRSCRAHLAREVAHADLHQSHRVALGLDVLHVVASVPMPTCGIDRGSVWRQRLALREQKLVPASLDRRVVVRHGMSVVQVRGRRTERAAHEGRSVVDASVVEERVAEQRLVKPLRRRHLEPGRRHRRPPDHRNRVPASRPDDEVERIDAKPCAGSSAPPSGVRRNAAGVDGPSRSVPDNEPRASLIDRRHQVRVHREAAELIPDLVDPHESLGRTGGARRRPRHPEDQACYAERDRGANPIDPRHPAEANPWRVAARVAAPSSTILAPNQLVAHIT